MVAGGRLEGERQSREVPLVVVATVSEGWSWKEESMTVCVCVCVCVCGNIRKAS